MTQTIQVKRGLAASNTGTHAVGEPVWTTDTKVLYIGDGSTSGGIALAMAGDLTTHINDTDNPHSVTATQVGADNIISEVNTNGTTTFDWDTVSKTGSNLTDIATRSHTDLTDIGTNTHSDIDTFISTLDAIDGLMKVDGAGTYSSITLDTDTTLAADSDTVVATQKAVKAYADNLIAANDAMVYKGVIDCSTNPNYPAADAGHVYKVSVAGKIGGASGPNVEVGDTLLCTTDSTASGDHATVGVNWNIIQVNIDGAVIGPASSTDDVVALFDGTTGKLLKNSTLTATNLGSAVSHVSNTSNPHSVTANQVGADNIISEVNTNGTTTFDWDTVSKTGSNLTDIATRSHTDLTDIGTNTHSDIDTHIADTTIHFTDIDGGTF